MDAVGAKVEMTQRDAGGFVVGRCFFPFFHQGDVIGDRVHGFAGGHVAYLDERDGYEAGTAQASDGFCDEPIFSKVGVDLPFVVALGNDDYRFSLFGVELVGTFRLKIELDYCV